MDWYFDTETGLFYTGKDREWQVAVNVGEDVPFGSLLHYGEFVRFVDSSEEAEAIIEISQEIAP